MMEVPIALFVVLIALVVAGMFFVIGLVVEITEGRLVPAKRIEDHSEACYVYDWEQRKKLRRRIEHLEKQLLRVPKAMRSRKARKLVG